MCDTVHCVKLYSVFLQTCCIRISQKFLNKNQWEYFAKPEVQRANQQLYTGSHTCLLITVANMQFSILVSYIQSYCLHFESTQSCLVAENRLWLEPLSKHRACKSLCSNFFFLHRFDRRVNKCTFKIKAQIHPEVAVKPCRSTFFASFMPVQNVHRPSQTDFDLTQHITVPVVQSRTALC